MTHLDLETNDCAKLRQALSRAVENAWEPDKWLTEARKALGVEPPTVWERKAALAERKRQQGGRP